MLVFEEVITYSAEAKTGLSQCACIALPNHRGGLMAKYELRPEGNHICPSTKLVVGLMNSQCYRDNPFSCNLFLRSLENVKKWNRPYYIISLWWCFQAALFCLGDSVSHTRHISNIQNLFRSCLELVNMNILQPQSSKVELKLFLNCLNVQIEVSGSSTHPFCTLTQSW